jgi:hypothetical protein
VILPDVVIKSYTSGIQCRIFRSELTDVSKEHVAYIFKKNAEFHAGLFLVSLFCVENTEVASSLET